MNMKRLKSLAVLCALLCTAFAFTACSGNDDPEQPGTKPEAETPKETVILPSMAFGTKMADLKAELAKASGTTVADIDATHFKATTTQGTVTVEYTYAFDADSLAYQYAEGALGKGNTLDGYVKYLTDNKFTEEKSGNADERIFRAPGEPAQLLVLDVKAGKIFYGEGSEAPYSWTRTKPFTGEGGLFLPFFGKNAPLSLIQSYEKRLGHTVNAAKTSEKDGGYAFNTGDEKFPVVKYWLDEETGTKLVDAVLYVQNKNVVTPAQVTAFLKSLGFYYTSQTDPRDGSTIYYNAKRKVAAFVLMTPTEGSGVQPNINFAYVNLDGSVPPETIDFPWPNTKFMQITMDEAIDAYQKYDYFKSIDPVEEGTYMLTTTSADIPQSIIFAEGDKYACLVMMPRDAMVAKSPYIQALLTEKGFVYVPDIIMPTFRNVKEGIEVQIDPTGDLYLGFPTIAFQPIEDAAGAKASTLVKMLSAKRQLRQLKAVR